MKLLTSLAAAILISSTASARIGETMNQCIQRYGEPNKFQRAGSAYIFSMGGFQILIEFFDNVAGVITVSKAEPLSSDEVATIMTANGGGQKWVLTSKLDDQDTTWLTADGKVAAIRSGADGSLTLASRAAEKILAERKRKAAAGF